jgi:8-oxo-dGTP diphosphatase
MMSGAEQGIGGDQYTVVPRTAIFLRRDDSYLLIHGAPTKRRWANKYNGAGGHIERGEDILASAARELREETGLEGDLWLCGTVMVDAGDVGVALFVFSGEASGGSLRASVEGDPEWIPYDRVPNLPAAGDLHPLLERIHRMRRGDRPFAARSFYDGADKLMIEFWE